VLGSGDLLGERYRLDERIAAGGMGDVWRATDLVLGRVVAVKVVRGALLADPAFSARFRSEARLLAAFRHPGVVDVYDYGESAEPAEGAENEAAYLVMAYVKGEPLSARIATQGRLSAAETASVITQAARALHAVHENGIIHRDVKPGNLLIQPDGTVILVDFGVAYSAAVTRVTGVNDVIGTALYMAPEQVSKLALSAATDVYALGAVGYHCLAGQPPFTGDNAVQVAMRHLEDDPPPLPPDVPAPIRAVIGRAMAKDPADRYASAAELAAAVDMAQQGIAASTAVQTAPQGIAGFAAGRASPGYAAAVAGAERAGAAPTRTFPAGTPPAKSRDARRRRALVAGTLLSVLLGVGALAAVLLNSGGGNGPAPKLTPTSQTTTPAGSNPAQVSDRGTGSQAASPSRPAATATAPSAGNSPSQPAASRSPNPSPTQNASPTSQQATSPAAASGAPSSTAGVTNNALVRCTTVRCPLK
jgi:serine/threonine-protein kinase